MVLKSKVGDLLAILYVILVGYVLWQGFSCSGKYCGIIVGIPVLPWRFTLQGLISKAILNSWYMYVLFVVINGLILYEIGALIEWSMPSKIRNKL